MTDQSFPDYIKSLPDDAGCVEITEALAEWREKNDLTDADEDAEVAHGD